MLDSNRIPLEILSRMDQRGVWAWQFKALNLHRIQVNSYKQLAIEVSRSRQETINSHQLH